MDKYRPLMDEYVDNQPKPMAITPENWSFLKELVTDINHPLYKDLVQREVEYTSVFGKNETKGLIYKIQMAFFADKKEWKNYVNSAVGYVESVETVDGPTMVPMVWTLIGNIKDKKILQKVRTAMQRVAELEPTTVNLQTNAQLLAKIGDKREAVKQAELAIKKAKENGDDYQAMLDLVKEIDGFLRQQY